MNIFLIINFFKIQINPSPSQKTKVEKPDRKLCESALS